MGTTLFWLRVTLAVALYGFIGWLFALLWRSLDAERKRPVSNVTAARLVCLSDALPRKRTYSLRPVTAIGRALNNDIVLHDPFASAHHALILWRDGRWWLEDLSSQNGTWLNEELVSSPTTLTFGDLIRIGKTELFFEADDTPDTEPVSTQKVR